MRNLLALLLAFVSSATAGAQAPKLVAKPDAFQTLVNPACSHCRDEAKRRADELKPDDRVLCWTRGYSEGGAIPYRFFLHPYRVISDTYGVFVLDPDAGFARGFAPSLDFRFHGWRNGVMVMSHKDGTLYSCLTGIAFDGPRKGDQLAPVATLTSDWGHWLKTYPQAVAYRMFDKYQPVDLPAKESGDSVLSRGAVNDALPAETQVLGVRVGSAARAYPVETLAKQGLVLDQLDGRDLAVVWHAPTKAAAAYHPVASPPKKGEPRTLTLKRDAKNPDAPLVDDQTGSRWDVAGRAVEGELQGWTLEWADGVQVKWFAWSAELPHTTRYTGAKTDPQPKAKADVKEAIKEIAGTAEFLKAVPKKFATLTSVDVAKRRVTLLADGDKEAVDWPLTPDAEVKIKGWWGRLDDLNPGGARVWAWFKVDRAKKAVAVFMLADSLSEQDIHGDGLPVQSMDDDFVVLKRSKDRTLQFKRSECRYVRDTKAAPLDELKPKDRVFVDHVDKASGVQTLLLDRASFESLRSGQKAAQRSRWIADGLPGTLGFLHVYSGEADLLVDHEGARWSRSLQPGDKIEIVADPPIKAVVKAVTAQRERTQVRVVANSFDLADLATGQRLRMRMATPANSVDADVFPADIDRVRTKEERIDWFLANIYCVCGVTGDVCTGHFYTLASCNPNGCGAPNATRALLARKIDEGLTNRQIFQHLLDQRGPLLLRPHLLP